MEKTVLVRYASGDRKKNPHDFELLYIEAKLLQLRRQNIQWKQKLRGKQLKILGSAKPNTVI